MIFEFDPRRAFLPALKRSPASDTILSTPLAKSICPLFRTFAGADRLAYGNRTIEWGLRCWANSPAKISERMWCFHPLFIDPASNLTPIAARRSVLSSFEAG